MSQFCISSQLFFVIICFFYINNVTAQREDCSDISRKCEQWTMSGYCKRGLFKIFMRHFCCQSCSESQSVARDLSPTGPIVPNRRDCKELLDMGFTDDGVYTITPNDTPVDVYCDMTDGGWTLIQKRTDDSLDYDRNFESYSEGFGDINEEHWLGLNNVHLLTVTGNWTLRFELVAFNNETAWAEYTDFRVSAGTDFTLTFDRGSYRGSAGGNDGLYTRSHEMKFSTADFDQDLWHDDQNCGEKFAGGWWYKDCMLARTTGPYGEDYSIYWWDWKDEKALKAATMKIMLH